jgi:hypothetical protein
MNFYIPPSNIYVVITHSDPGWSQYDLGPATAAELRALEDGRPPRSGTEPKPTKSAQLDLTVSPPRDCFLENSDNKQPFALRGTAFRSWSEFDDTVRKHRTAEASASIIAVAHAAGSLSVPAGFEIRFCLPGARTAVYQHLSTGEIVVLKQEGAVFKKL